MPKVREAMLQSSGMVAESPLGAAATGCINIRRS